MKNIRVVYGNHWNFGIHVSDTVRLIKCALEDIGFRVDIEKDISDKSINIIIENFSDEYLNKVKSCYERGGRFIIVATEFLTVDTFNDFGGDVNDKSHYENKVYWQERFKNFLEVLKFSDAVFHLSEHQVPVYKRFFEGKPVIYLPHCYVSNFSTVKMRPNQERDVDVLFTGTLTDYRKKILSGIEEAGYKVKNLPMLTASFHRDDLISRSKVCLNLPQNERWDYQSNSRIHYHLINESPIVTQKTNYECDIQKYAVSFRKGRVLDVLNSITINERLDNFFDNSFYSFKQDTALIEKFKLDFLSLIQGYNYEI